MKMLATTYIRIENPRKDVCFSLLYYEYLSLYLPSLIFHVRDHPSILHSTSFSGNLFDMSQDSTKVIDHLVSECAKYMTDIMGRMKHCPDKDTATVWDQADQKFVYCLVLSSRDDWTNPAYIEQIKPTQREETKPLARIDGGIDRYPNTAVLLIVTLRDIIQNLVKALGMMAGQTPQANNDQSTQPFDNPTSIQELRVLGATVLGSMMVLFNLTEHVCPRKNALFEKYHDQALATFERGLVSVAQKD